MTFIAQAPFSRDLIDDIGRVVTIGERVGIIGPRPTGTTTIPPRTNPNIGPVGQPFPNQPPTLGPFVGIPTEQFRCNCGEGSVCTGRCSTGMFGTSTCDECRSLTTGQITTPVGEISVQTPSGPNGTSTSVVTPAPPGMGCDCIITTRTGRQLRGRIDRKTGRCKQIRRANPGNIKARKRDLTNVKATLRELEKFGSVFDKTAKEVRPQRRKAAARKAKSCGCGGKCSCR